MLRKQLLFRLRNTIGAGLPLPGVLNVRFGDPDSRGWARESVVDSRVLVVGICDAIVCLAQTLVAASAITEEQLVAAFRTAEQQQLAEQPALVDPAGRSLIIRVIGDFFERRIRPPGPLN
jgi:hypothetical protein